VLAAANKRLLISESHDDSNRCTHHVHPTLNPRMVPDHTYLMWSTLSNLSRVTDRSAGPHLVCLLLSSKEVVGLSQASVDSRLLGLSGPYHRHAIGTFNTCLRGATHQSLTDTCSGYNHLRALPGLPLSNLNITSSEKV
jgi:hypothetical protein